MKLFLLSLRYNIRSRYTAYETVVTATESEVEELPRLFSYLDGNYPNPFNPSTTIRFFIGDAAGQTKLLKIYNLLGQLVAVIDISHLRAGWHEVRFDGLDRYGRMLPSGLYLVRLQINNSGKDIRITMFIRAGDSPEDEYGTEPATAGYENII